MSDILVLDQSLSSTGFALLDGSWIISSGAWPLCDGMTDRAHGYVTLWGKLDELHKGRGLSRIIHEMPALGAVNKGAEQIFGALGLVAIVELFSRSRGLPAPIGYAPKTWRSTFFSRDERAALKGKSWKRPAIERCRQLGFDPVTSDEAEAIGIADHHLLKFKITPAWRGGTSLDLVAVA